jgi:hypothetical protein
MYCLTFSEGNIDLRIYFFHSLSKVTLMQRNMLLTEIDSIMNDDDKYINGCIKFDSCTNNELQRLLTCFISLKYNKENYQNKVIEIEINELIFEDIIDSCD